MTAVDGDCYLAAHVVWEPFVLAVVMGLVVSAIIYFVVMWPQVEPDEGDEGGEAGEGDAGDEGGGGGEADEPADDPDDVN